MGEKQMQVRHADPLRPRRRVVRLATIAAASMLAMSLAGCLGYSGEVRRGYVVEDKMLDQIKPGLPAEKVLDVLGDPSTTSTVGGDAWYYISQLVTQSFEFTKPQITDQRVVAVYFDKTKKVQRIANYGLQDGKVFDFISRTTPTAGKEQNFVGNLFRSLTNF